MTLIASLAVLLATAHLLGWLAERCGQPALLGQMLAGILLGPSILSWLKPGPGLAAIADLAVLFVVITAGLEMRIHHVLDTFRGRGIWALALTFMIPATSAAAFSLVKGLAFVPVSVVALCISVTALPVAVRILGTFDLLKTRIASVAIAGALLSDISALMLLGILIAVSASENSGYSVLTTTGIALAKLLLLLLVVGICHYVCSKLSMRDRLSAAAAQRTPADKVLILAVLFIVVLGVISEQLGFHFAIGAFLASLLVTGDLIGDVRFRWLEQTCELMTVSVFGPLFLAYQGVQFDMGALGNVALVLGLIIIAVVSKLIGGYAAARLKALSHYESCGVAIIMNARGVMEMVIASIAWRAGLVSRELFSALLIVGIATTVLTPTMLKQWSKNRARMKALLSESRA